MGNYIYTQQVVEEKESSNIKITEENTTNSKVSDHPLKDTETKNTNKPYVPEKNETQETEKDIQNLDEYIKYCKSEKGKKAFSNIQNLDEQVEAIENYKNGKLSYSEMRALAG